WGNSVGSEAAAGGGKAVALGVACAATILLSLPHPPFPHTTAPQSETILLDLKHLLREAKQRIPPVLASLDDPMEDAEALAAASGVRGCAFCGGLGHRISECPKLEHQKTQAISGSHKDYLGSGGYGGEM
ncbi:unnamed protein product, partial [Closterium sp. Yama58-4]